MFKKFSIIGVLITTSTFFLLTASPVYAHCPLCVAGATIGVSLTRYLGVDDSITGVWIAALLGASSFWFYSWLVSKKIKKLDKYKKILKPAVYILVWVVTLWSFYKFQLIIRMSQIFGVDKLTFGMLAGGILFYLVDAIKIRHYFKYQKIVISMASMVILSLLIYLMLNFYI